MEEGQKMNIKYTELNEDYKYKKTVQSQKHTDQQIYIPLDKHERNAEDKPK